MILENCHEHDDVAAIAKASHLVGAGHVVVNDVSRA
jgi:hypothetical protein